MAGNEMGKRPVTIRGRLLPFRKGHRTDPAMITTGSYALVRAYYNDGISRRTREGQAISRLEREFAEHLGCRNLSELAITTRLKVQLAVGNLLLMATFQPAPDSKTGLRDVATAQNTLNRILTELGLEKKKPPMQSLQEYLIAKERERAEAAKAQAPQETAEKPKGTE
jgi:hypothetical protein